MTIENLKLHKRLNEVWQYFAKDNWDLIPACDILQAMYNVFKYRNQIHNSTTPEQESIARWNLADAKTNLSAKMYQYGLPENIKESIKLYCGII